MDQNLNKLISIQSETNSDDLFKNNRKWISNFLKDDKNLGFVNFKKKLEESNIIIRNHSNIKSQSNPEIEIHFAKTYKKKFNCIQYLLLPEAKEIIKKNDLNKLKFAYDKIFCQYDDYIDNEKIFKLYYPYDLNISDKLVPFNDRKFACIITSNKNLKFDTKNNLYPFRYKLIKWYERNRQNKLESFGIDWHLPMKKTGYLGRVLNFINKSGFYKLYYKSPKNYMGLVKSKKETLSNFKFAFCFENCSINGYLSDIIFDSMNTLTVPIYLGPKNINDYLPESCFINFRNFKNFEELDRYLNNIDKKKYEEIINNIFSFYKSVNSEVFKMNSFINILVSSIKKDLNLI